MSERSDYIQQQIIKAGAANFASQSAEESVICSLVSRTDDAAHYAMELSESDFYFPDYGRIFKAIQTVLAKGQSVDLVTVDAAIGELYPLEQTHITSTMIGRINGTAIGLRNIEDYIRIVKDLSTRRQSIKSFEGLVARLKDPSEDIGDILDQMRTEGNQITMGNHKWQSMPDVLMATYEYLEKRAKGEIKSITTGIGNMDSLIGGFFGGELTVIGARPSVGKSAFGANIAIEAARRGYHVAVVSREMTSIQYGQRMLAHDSWVDGMRLRKGELNEDDWGRLAESMSVMADMPISFMFTVRTVEDLRMEVQRKAERGELDMLMVDYLQLMDTQRRFREEHLRVGYISKALKDIATDFNIPVIALAQVNRDTDGQMPTLKSLKASGDIEQDADGVIFLHRPSDAQDAYVDPRDREYFPIYEQQGYTYLCVCVAKQRQGVVGRASVLFDSAHMRYLEIDRNRG